MCTKWTEQCPSTKGASPTFCCLMASTSRSSFLHAVSALLFMRSSSSTRFSCKMVLAGMQTLRRRAAHGSHSTRFSRLPCAGMVARVEELLLRAASGLQWTVHVPQSGVKPPPGRLLKPTRLHSAHCGMLAMPRNPAQQHSPHLGAHGLDLLVQQLDARLVLLPQPQPLLLCRRGCEAAG